MPSVSQQGEWEGSGRRLGLLQRVSLGQTRTSSSRLGYAECAPAPPSRAPSPALGPAYPRVDPSLARFACGCCGARARPRSGQREAAVTGAGLQTCQTRGAGLELRALQARDRPRSPAAPGRAVRAGLTKPAEGGEMNGGPAAAPQVDAPPLRGAPAPWSRPCVPCRPGLRNL